MPGDVPIMSFNKGGHRFDPLAIFEPDSRTLVGVYQGRLSEFDMLVKYRQLDQNGKWSNLRTPKHIHWAVDLLIKMHQNRALTQQFLDMLLEIWAETIPLVDADARTKVLNMESLLEKHRDTIDDYKKVSRLGEYSIEFLILMAKLLMIQEKTNYPDAYMFKRLLEKLRAGKDIFSIISTATHVGR